MSHVTKSTARNRREKENGEFNELAKLLPLPAAITCQLDKASVVRLTTSYLHLRTVFPHGLGNCWIELRSSHMPEIRELASNLLQTLDGFIFVLSPQGKIMYITETASTHLGLSQVELTGNSVYDYVHPHDHLQLEHVLKPIDEETDDANDDFECMRHFFVRMKCVLAKRNAGLTDQGYKVIHCSGYLKFRQSNGLEMGGANSREGVENVGLIAMGHTLPCTAITEIRLSSAMFMFRASLDFKIVFLDSRVSEITGFDLQELLDRSIYDLSHASDAKHLSRSHRILLEKHQVTTQFYRLLVKGGGWLWIQSQLTLIQLPRASRPACIVGISHVLSHVECPGLILHTIQETSDAHKSTVSPDSHSTLGAYSESYYGPNAVRLVQPGLHEQHNPFINAQMSYPTGPYHLHETVIKCGSSHRKRLQYQDAVTGEKRYCLRNSTCTSAAAAAFPSALPQIPVAEMVQNVSDAIETSYLPPSQMIACPMQQTDISFHDYSRGSVIVPNAVL